MRFDTPLADRVAKAAYKRSRYRADPDYRLKAINRARRNAGHPPLASLDQSTKLALPLEVHDA